MHRDSVNKVIGPILHDAQQLRRSVEHYAPESVRAEVLEMIENIEHVVAGAFHDMIDDPLVMTMQCDRVTVQ